MTTMARRKSAAKKKAPKKAKNDVLCCHVCLRKPCECNQGRGASVESATLGGDPVGDLCGSPFSAGALSHAAAAAGGFVMAALLCVVAIAMGWV